jgi:hypothetical protein
MKEHNALQEGLVWLPDGHVSEWVLNALLDDEAVLLPGDAVSHVDTCEHCTDRLATMAHLVFALDEELSVLAEDQAKQEAPFPSRLFAGAMLFVAGLGLFSWSVHGTALAELPHELLTVSRALRVIGAFAADQHGGKLLVLGSFTAIFAAVYGVALAKRHPFHRPPESLS